MSTSNNRDNFEQSQLRLYSQELLIVKISLNNTLKKKKKYNCHSYTSGLVDISESDWNIYKVISF